MKACYGRNRKLRKHRNINKKFNAKLLKAQIIFRHDRKIFYNFFVYLRQNLKPKFPPPKKKIMKNGYKI